MAIENSGGAIGQPLQLTLRQNNSPVTPLANKNSLNVENDDKFYTLDSNGNKKAINVGDDNQILSWLM